MKNIVWLDKYGFPLTYFKNRFILNTLRFVLHVSLIKTFSQIGRWQRKSAYGLVDTWCKEDVSVWTEKKN